MYAGAVQAQGKIDEKLEEANLVRSTPPPGAALHRASGCTSPPAVLTPALKPRVRSSLT